MDHDDPNSRAFMAAKDALLGYIEGQGAQVEAIRSRQMPNHPWPEGDNPMFGYLLNRAMEILKDEGPQAALTWLGAHAWFEGSLEERARLLLHLSA